MTFASVQDIGVPLGAFTAPQWLSYKGDECGFRRAGRGPHQAIILSKSYFMYIHPRGCHRIQTSRPAGTGSGAAGEGSPPETKGKRISTVSPPSARLKAATRPP